VDGALDRGITVARVDPVEHIAEPLALLAVALVEGARSSRFVAARPTSRTRLPGRSSMSTSPSIPITARASTEPSLVGSGRVVRRDTWRKSSCLTISTAVWARRCAWRSRAATRSA
jgi:hypothetical protein